MLGLSFDKEARLKEKIETLNSFKATLNYVITIFLKLLFESVLRILQRNINVVKKFYTFWC